MEILNGYSNDEYHARSEVSSTQLKTIHDHGPMYFRYIADEYNKIRNKDALEFGTMAHTYLLEPKEFEKLYWLENPEGKKIDRRIGKYKDAAKKNAGKKIVTFENQQKLTCMKLSIDNTIAKTESGDIPVSEFINPENSIIEQARVWDHDIGESLRAKADMFYKNVACIDLKTIDCLEETFRGADNDYMQQITARNYDLQAAHYSEGFQTDIFIIIYIEKQTPFRCRVVQLSQAQMKIGYDKFNRALEIYHNCKKTGVWADYIEWEIA